MQEITVKKSEAEKEGFTTKGIEVAQIDVTRDDGPEAKARFWVDVRVNKRGQAVLHVATNKKDGTTVTKELTGVWI